MTVDAAEPGVNRKEAASAVHREHDEGEYVLTRGRSGTARRQRLHE